MRRALFLLALALCGCAAFLDKVDPVNLTAYTPRAWLPCGELGVVCIDSSLKATGKCCDTGETCGIGAWPNVGCPAGECCPIGSGMEVGARRHHAQWAAGSRP